MKYKIVAIFLCIISISVATEMNMGAVTIRNGEFSQMSYEGSPFGGLKGTVRLKIGNYSWSPESVWLVPEGMNSDQFRYTGDYYSVPSSMNLTNNCKSNIYYNSTLDRYAFKTGIAADGSYCILADAGDYNVLAEY